MVTWAQTAVCTAVSPMGGSPTCDTEKNRKTERGEFITPPRMRGYPQKLIRYITKRLKGGDRRVRRFSAHNNWWATPEVSLLLPYQRSAKVFLNFFATRSEDNVLL